MIQYHYFSLLIRVDAKPNEEGVSHVEQHHVFDHEVLLYEVQHLLDCEFG